MGVIKLSVAGQLNAGAVTFAVVQSGWVVYLFLSIVYALGVYQLIANGGLV